MKDACLTSEEIADVIRGLASADAEQHINACAACTQRVTKVRRIARAGLRRIAEIAAEVEELVQKLLAAPREAWWKTVREPEYRRADVARRLWALAIDARLKDRALAVSLAKAATTIIEATEDRDPELRFEAWKLSSAILREAGRYAELPDTFTKAEEAAHATKDPELAKASLCLSRALFYAEPDVWQPEEAAALLDRAERVFDEADEPRMLALKTARAFLLFRAGDLRAASGVRVARERDVAGGRSCVPRCVEQLALGARRVGRSLRRYPAGARFTRGSKPTPGPASAGRARTLDAGKVCSVLGQHDGAVELLSDARSGIEDDNAAIRVGVDAVAALLLAERHHDAYVLARELASDAVALDQRERSRRHTLTTQVLAYLREAAQRQALTADLVTECARYLDRITRQRPVEFIPPMPLTEM